MLKIALRAFAGVLMGKERWEKRRTEGGEESRGICLSHAHFDTYSAGIF